MARAQLPALTTASSVTVRLNEPGSLYFDRLSQWDLSLSKFFRQGRFRIKPQLDFFNILNANTVTSGTLSWPSQG